MRYIETTYHQNEWADEFFEVENLEHDGEEIQIWISPKPAVERGDVPEVEIIWSGALEFAGTLTEANESYPELSEWLL